MLRNANSFSSKLKLKLLHACIRLGFYRISSGFSFFLSSKLLNQEYTELQVKVMKLLQAAPQVCMTFDI